MTHARRLPLLAALSTALVALVTPGLASAPAADAGPPPPRRRPPTSGWPRRSWSPRLADAAPSPFQPTAGPDEPTITVDPSRAYQTMDGFGASITDSSAHVLYRLRDGGP